MVAGVFRSGLSIGLAALLAHGGLLRASAPQATTGPDIVVNGVRDIVVNGRAKACKAIPGDPFDKVHVAASSVEPPPQSEIARLRDGRYVFQADQETLTGPDIWARAGRGIDEYIFRAPADGRPLCIGARAPDRHTFGQLRRIVDARPYWGKRIRFTLWVASGDASLVRFWLVAGGRGYQGGHSKDHPWGGNHGWTPVMLEIGPVSPHADHISYGFLLDGHGAVWAYKPQLEVVDDAAASRKHDLLFIGSDH